MQILKRSTLGAVVALGTVALLAGCGSSGSNGDSGGTGSTVTRSALLFGVDKGVESTQEHLAPDVDSPAAEPTAFSAASLADQFFGERMIVPEIVGQSDGWVVRSPTGAQLGQSFDWTGDVAFSPDGRHIAMSLDVGGGLTIVDGTGSNRLDITVEDENNTEAVIGWPDLRFRFWLDDSHLLVDGPGDVLRIAELDGETLKLGAVVEPDVDSITAPAPGSNLIFRSSADRLDYGTLDAATGAYRALGNLKTDEGFQEPQVVWAPVGPYGAVLSEEADPSKVCEFSETGPATCVAISGVGDDDLAPWAAWRDDTHFAIGSSSGTMYTVDATTGAARPLEFDVCRQTACYPYGYASQASIDAKPTGMSGSGDEGLRSG